MLTPAVLAAATYMVGVFLLAVCMMSCFSIYNIIMDKLRRNEALVDTIRYRQRRADRKKEKNLHGAGGVTVLTVIIDETVEYPD